MLSISGSTVTSEQNLSFFTINSYNKTSLLNPGIGSFSFLFKNVYEMLLGPSVTQNFQPIRPKLKCFRNTGRI